MKFLSLRVTPPAHARSRLPGGLFQIWLKFLYIVFRQEVDGDVPRLWNLDFQSFLYKKLFFWHRLGAPTGDLDLTGLSQPLGWPLAEKSWPKDATPKEYRWNLVASQSLGAKLLKNMWFYCFFEKSLNRKNAGTFDSARPIRRPREEVGGGVNPPLRTYIFLNHLEPGGLGLVKICFRGILIYFLQDYQPGEGSTSILFAGGSSP